MNNSKEILSPTRVRLTVEMTADDLQPAVTKAFKTISAQVNIPGFRKGKVPPRIIEQRFGRGVVLEEALQESVPTAYSAALTELEIEPLGQPSINIDTDLAEIGPDDSITFVAEVDVKPEFDLPDYRGLAVDVDDAEVTDEQAQAALDELRSRFATMTPVDRAVEDGDVVVVDVVGTIDGEEVTEFTNSGMSFEVGSGQMIEGFDAAVLGKSEGEDATFTYTPAEGEFAGKDVELTVSVKGVRERELPEADDEFAMLASEFDTIEELIDDLRVKLERSSLVEQGIQARDKLAEALLEMVDIPVPEGLLAEMLDQHFQDGHGDDEHRSEVTADTEKAIRSQFLLDAIADAENVEVDQQDLTNWIVQQAPRYGMTTEQFVQALVQADQIQNAYGDVRRGKALTVVLEAATITDASGNVVDLTALDEEESEDGDDAVEAEESQEQPAESEESK